MYLSTFELNTSRIQAQHISATENRSVRRMFYCIGFGHRPWILRALEMVFRNFVAAQSNEAG
jgi:hypothetical protein